MLTTPLVDEAPAIKLLGPEIGNYFKFHNRLYYVVSERIDEDDEGNQKKFFNVENCSTLYKGWVEARLLRRIEVIIPDAV